MTTVSRIIILSFAISISLASSGCDRGSSDPGRGGQLLQSDLADEPEPRPWRPRSTREAPATPPEAQPEVMVEAPPLTPPDAGLRATGAPIRPGDFLPSTEAPPSPAAFELDQVTSAPELPQGPPCEHSFDILRALALEANRALPRRDDYLRACEALPPGMQRCLDPGYRSENEQECYDAHTGTAPALLERLRQIVDLELD